MLQEILKSVVKISILLVSHSGFQCMALFFKCRSVYEIFLDLSVVFNRGQHLYEGSVYLHAGITSSNIP